MLEEDQEQKVKLGIYQHYKGKRYLTLHVATHSESLEKVVVYQQLYGNQSIWVRPLSMFVETVTVDGCCVPRFKFIAVNDE